MSLNKKNAIDSNKTELFNTLGNSLVLFLSYLEYNGIINREERKLVDNKLTNEDKLMLLFRWIESKDRGLDYTISYLKTNEYGILADKLKASTEETVSLGHYTVDVPVKDPPILSDFQNELANSHRKFQFSHVPTIFGVP